MLKYMVYYLILTNITTFFIFGLDKLKAKKKKRRVPEKFFYTWAFFGGATGILIGMYTFRHKTLHKTFKYGMPALLIWNIIAIYMIMVE